MKRSTSLVVIALLLGCAATPYQQPSDPTSAAKVTFRSFDVRAAVDVYGSQDCSSTSAQGRILITGTGQTATASIKAGERVYLRVLGQSHPGAIGAGNSMSWYKCTQLVTFVPEPQRVYRISASSGERCSIDVFEGESNFFPPKTMRRLPVTDSCKAKWE